MLFIIPLLNIILILYFITNGYTLVKGLDRLNSSQNWYLYLVLGVLVVFLLHKVLVFTWYKGSLFGIKYLIPNKQNNVYTLLNKVISMTLILIDILILIYLCLLLPKINQIETHVNLLGSIHCFGDIFLYRTYTFEEKKLFLDTVWAQILLEHQELLSHLKINTIKINNTNALLNTLDNLQDIQEYLNKTFNEIINTIIKKKQKLLELELEKQNTWWNYIKNSILTSMYLLPKEYIMFFSILTVSLLTMCPVTTQSAVVLASELYNIQGINLEWFTCTDVYPMITNGTANTDLNYDPNAIYSHKKNVISVFDSKYPNIIFEEGKLPAFTYEEQNPITYVDIPLYIGNFLGVPITEENLKLISKIYLDPTKVGHLNLTKHLTTTEDNMRVAERFVEDDSFYILKKVLDDAKESKPIIEEVTSDSEESKPIIEEVTSDSEN